MPISKAKLRGPLKKGERAIERLGLLADSPWYSRSYVRHGSRALLVVILAGLSLLLTPGRGPTDFFLGLEVGRVADRDVIAPFEFSVYKSEEALGSERTEAADKVLPVLEFIPQVKERVLQDLNGFFDELKGIAIDTALADEIISWDTYKGQGAAMSAEFKIGPQLLNSLYSIDPDLSLSDEEIIYLLDSERRRELRKSLQNFLVQHLNEGLIGGELAEEIDGRLVRLGRDDGERQVPINELTHVDQVLDQAREVVVDPEYPELSRNLFIETLRRFIRPNIVYNLPETERLRRQATEQIKSTRDQAVLEGEKIIGRGERISPEQMEKLNNLRARIEAISKDQHSYWRNDTGLFLIYLVAFLFIGLFLYYHQRSTYEQFYLLLIISISLLLVLGFSYLILSSPQLSNYLIPVAICSMLVAYLIDDRVAMVATFAMALILGVQAGFSFITMIMALLGGLAGAFSERGITSRRVQYLSILYITAAYLVGILAIDYGIKGEKFAALATASGWSLLNAFVSTVVTMGLLPLFEYVFKITSNFSLLELSDLNRPLLKRMALEAPGTYHHSIILGNLGEAAAAGIGANPIYARVAAYYHDIGKLKKPQYFIENQSGKSNPHDKLNPKMSSLIIASHVKEGIELARKAKLPQCIIDVIGQHHGNTPISFFFTKEKELNPKTTLDEDDFCYPGPRPRSKEAAIIMLADAVESASRVLSDPTPSRIKGLIKGIIDDKLHGGQLDQADLTLRDLNRIAEEFLTILIGVHHQRIDYPSSTEKAPDAKARPPRNRGAPGSNSENAGRVTHSSQRDNIGPA